MSHDATAKRHGHRASRRLLGAVVGTMVLAGAGAATASAQFTYPATSGDPRIGLAAGLDDATAGKAALGLQHLVNKPKPAAVSGTNSDMAFQGKYAFNGNYNGVNIYNVENPADPQLVTSLVCPGSQNDVSVYKNLLFMSVESTAGKKDCSSTPAATPETRFRGVRIFDISDINNPVQLNGVQTCRGSHTHTLVRPKNDPNNVYIYVSGTAGVRAATELAGCDGGAATNPNPSQWRIEVIKVPLANPNAAAVVNEARVFKNEETGAVNGLQNGPTTPKHPCTATAPNAAGGGCAPGTNPATSNWSPSPNTNQCHDITVYEAIDLAAGACAGNGLLIDISDPANPKRIDAVADPQFSYWHGATFSHDGKAVLFTDEWGGGSGARCRATDAMSWGADAIYEIVNKKLVFRSYYKLPVAQTVAENCVSHVGNMLPIRGKNIMIQAWYQGGASLIDWTDLSNPKEIGYFDRGPRTVPANNGTDSAAGYWSTYWYNGHIYGSEIGRGLDVFKLTPTANGLTAGDIDMAERIAAKTERANPQSQDVPVYLESPPVNGGATGTVPATLSLTLGAAASFPPFTPGVANTYTASTTANVIHTAGDATLTVADTGANPGHLVNGAFSLPQPLQGLGVVKTWSGPTSNEAVPVTFSQAIGANDALRTGTYSKTLTFTLSTTNP